MGWKAAGMGWCLVIVFVGSFSYVDGFLCLLCIVASHSIAINPLYARAATLRKVHERAPLVVDGLVYSYMSLES